jgi:hypothetical protein
VRRSAAHRLGHDADHVEQMCLAQQQRHFAYSRVESAHQEDARAAALLRQEAQQLDAVGAGHHKVEDDDVGTRRTVQRTEVVGSRGEMHLVAEVLCDTAHEGADIGFVIAHQQQLRGHGWPSFTSSTSRSLRARSSFR